MLNQLVVEAVGQDLDEHAEVLELRLKKSVALHGVEDRLDALVEDSAWDHGVVVQADHSFEALFGALLDT